MSLIEKELKDGDNKYWFYRKQQKNLHNIDTFYYSVMLENDFIEPGDENVHFFLTQLDAFKNRCLESNEIYGEIYTPFDPLDFRCSDNLVYAIGKGNYAHIYNHVISCPDVYDIYIASHVPNVDTPQIVVQIRSKELWLSGVNSIYKRSFDAVSKICSLYHLNIKEVNENRTDFCWHTNYLSNPEKYFKIDNFAKMQVSHFNGSNMHYAFLANDEFENDYIALGKRGDKCFVRMYLKTKEVVEMGYKPWFINLWFFNELISRYDKYVLENCFDLRNWKVKDIIRLQFYYDYGQNEQYKQMCYAAMESYFRKGSCNWDYVGKLADKLTPKITTIMNVEFQVMRKMSKSFCLIDLHPSHKVDHRINMFLENHELITDYLLTSVLRLVDRNTALKKCECTDTPFWQSIKRTKMIDVRKKNKNISPLHREYSREHNIEVVKNSFINKAITLGIYTHGIDYKEDIQTTIADNLCLLNDNDVKRAERYRSKVSTRLNKRTGRVILMQRISDYIKMFIQDRKVYCEDVTVQSYIFYLQRFTKWLDSDDFDLLNKQTLRDYIYSLRYRMKNTSIATNYRPVKAFCKWLYQEDYLEKDITIGVKLPKKDAAIVEPLTDEEVHQIDDAIINKSVNKHIALRNYCIFHLALDCGLRRKEIVQLRRMDIKHDRLIIHNAKNNKDRIVLLPRFLYMSLNNYYNESHYHYHFENNSKFLFLDFYDIEPITLNTIKCFYQDLKSLSGIDRIHGHLCRHTFATSFLQYGGDMEKLRLFMGHADYEILKNYLHLSLIYPDVYKIDDIFFN